MYAMKKSCEILTRSVGNMRAKVTKLLPYMVMSCCLAKKLVKTDNIYGCLSRKI